MYKKLTKRHINLMLRASLVLRNEEIKINNVGISSLPIVEYALVIVLSYL